jgi:hypothetical protein
MRDDRLKISTDQAYACAVGGAVICFARLQALAVACCETLSPGYALSKTLRSASEVADDFIVFSLPAFQRTRFSGILVAAREYKRLALRRNALLHATPAPAPLGDERLFRRGAQWTTTIVNDLADEFAAAEIHLRRYVDVS